MRAEIVIETDGKNVDHLYEEWLDADGLITVSVGSEVFHAHIMRVKEIK